MQILFNGIIAGSIYALIAIGFAVIYKTVRAGNGTVLILKKPTLPHEGEKNIDWRLQTKGNRLYNNIKIVLKANKL